MTLTMPERVGLATVVMHYPLGKLALPEREAGELSWLGLIVLDMTGRWWLPTGAGVREVGAW